MKKLFLLLCCCYTSFAFSQGVQVNEDFAIKKMMDRHVDTNKSIATIDGWRVQILSTTDRHSVEDAKQKFMGRFPEILVDWTHSKPYYRLRAGAFSTKLEVMALLYRLKTYYPSAFPAKDNSIPTRELIGL